MNKIIFLLFFVTCGNIGFAQWTQCNGPFGGDITSITQNTQTNSIFASSGYEGIYRYNTTTGEWQGLSDHFPPNHRIGFRLRSTDSIIYAKDASGIFKSTDDGESWTQIFFDDMTSGTGMYCCQDNIIAILGSNSTIAVSLNYGVTFTEVSGNLVDNAPSFWDICMKGNRMFLLHAVNSGNNHTVSYSDDYGQTWHKPLIDLNSDALSFTRFRSFGSNLYALGSDSIYRSQDDGVTWHAVSSPGIPSGTIDDLYIANDTILASTYSKGLYISTNNGASYTQSYQGLPIADPRVEQIFPTSTKQLLLATNHGIFRSNNTGYSWSDFNQGIIAMEFTSFAYGPYPLYAGTIMGGIFETTDFGNSWVRKSHGLETTGGFESIEDIIVVGNRIIAATMNGIFYSDDNGNNWTYDPIANVGRTFRYDHGILFGGGSGLNYSSDSATTWTRFANGPSCGVVGLMVRDSLIIAVDVCTIFVPPHVTTEIQRSVDHGATFSVVNTSYAFTDIEIIDSLIFAANYYGNLLISDNLGQTWSVDPMFTNARIQDIYVMNDNYIFLGTDSGRIYQSADTGATWTDITGNFKGYPMRIIRYGNSLFVASANSGVWKLDVTDLIGIHENNIKEGLKVYPNPSMCDFNVTLPKELQPEQKLIVQIFNSMGKLIENSILHSAASTFTCSLRNEPPGVYYLILMNENVQYRCKLVKVPER